MSSPVLQFGLIFKTNLYFRLVTSERSGESAESQHLFSRNVGFGDSFQLYKLKAMGSLKYFTSIEVGVLCNRGLRLATITSVPIPGVEGENSDCV